MNVAPDGTEVVATPADAARLSRAPLLVLSEVAQFLDAEGIGDGPIAYQRIGEGQSNVTYLLRRGEACVVLRRGPRPPLPTSAHNMVRESRLLRMLAEAGLPVPRVLATCADDAVLGVPFYVMEFLRGVVITDHLPPFVRSDSDRRALAFSAVDMLVALHRVDVSMPPLSEFGRPIGYLSRQVSRFASLWEENTRRHLPEVGHLGEWLAARVPESQGSSIVHGDFRIGNLMYRTDGPLGIEAVLDWEMATIGDPLADLGYFTATYASAGSRATPMELTSVTREPGFPGRRELLERYRSAMPYDLSEIAWYQAFALWKSAVFCEAFYTRWMAGERPGDTFAPSLAEGVPELVRAAREFVGINA